MCTFVDTFHVSSQLVFNLASVSFNASHTDRQKERERAREERERERGERGAGIGLKSA